MEMVGEECEVNPPNVFGWSAKSARWSVGWGLVGEECEVARGVGVGENLDCSAVVSHARQRHAAFRSYRHYQDVRYRSCLSGAVVRVLDT